MRPAAHPKQNVAGAATGQSVSLKFRAVDLHRDRRSCRPPDELIPVLPQPQPEAFILLLRGSGGPLPGFFSVPAEPVGVAQIWLLAGSQYANSRRPIAQMLSGPHALRVSDRAGLSWPPQ